METEKLQDGQVLLGRTDVSGSGKTANCSANVKMDRKTGDRGGKWTGIKELSPLINQ